jgi:hypothetical protein
VPTLEFTFLLEHLLKLPLQFISLGCPFSLLALTSLEKPKQQSAHTRNLLQPTTTMTQNKSRAPRAGEVERKERRRAANRRSAQKSRYRETILMDELQRTVNDLTQKNELLRQENMKFRRDVEILQGFSISTSGCNKNQADSVRCPIRLITCL